MRLYDVNEVCRFCDKDCKLGLEEQLCACGYAFRTYRDLLKESEETGINKYDLGLKKYEHLGATLQDCCDYFDVKRDAIYKARRK